MYSNDNFYVLLVQMAYTHTIYPGFLPSGYFDDDNVDFIYKKIIEVLHQNFTQDILIPKGDIKKIMLRILAERLEEIPMMNQRVIMSIVSEFRNHELDVRKKLWWSERSKYALSLQDPTEGVAKYDPLGIKLANRLGAPRVGGTSRFYFT